MRAATRVLAHRGFHAPIGPLENSRGAFQRAIRLGADVLELDVRRTRDGVLVLSHDATYGGGSAKIAKLPFERLPWLAGEPPTTLDEVARMAAAHDAKLAVELKVGGIEQAAVDALRGAGLATDSFEVISFSPRTLRRVKAIDPQIRTGLLAPRIPGGIRESWAYRAALRVLDRLDWQPSLNRAARAGADYVSVDHRMLTPSFLAQAERRAIPFDVWTANTDAQITRAIRSGAQGVVTDRPDLAMRIRDAARTS